MRTERAECSPQQPPWTDQQVERIAKEGGLVPFNQVTKKLKSPADDEQGQGPAPVKEKQWQGNHDERNANAVRKLIQRMTMLGSVIVDEGFRHINGTDFSLSSSPK